MNEADFVFLIWLSIISWETSVDWFSHMPSENPKLFESYWK